MDYGDVLVLASAGQLACAGGCGKKFLHIGWFFFSFCFLGSWDMMHFVMRVGIECYLKLD